MGVFDDEQIQAIIQDFYKAMTHRQYQGSRYVPIFGRKDESTIEWDGGAAAYEPLTIVTYQGNSFTSRQYVPAGISITNNAYWASTGIYTAQIEQYRNEVSGFADGLATERAERIAADLAEHDARVREIEAESDARIAADDLLERNITANYEEIKANDIGGKLEGYSLFQADLLLSTTVIQMSSNNPFRLDLFTSKQVGIHGSADILDDIPALTNLFYFQVPIDSSVVRGYWNTGIYIRSGEEHIIPFFIHPEEDSYVTPDGIPMMSVYTNVALEAGDKIVCFPYMQSALGMGVLRPWANTLFTKEIARTAAYRMEQFSGLTYSNDFYLRTRIVPTYDADAEREYVKSNESDCSGTIWSAYYLALQDHAVPAVLSDYSVSIAAGGNHVRAWQQGEPWTAEELAEIVEPGDILTLSKAGEPGNWVHVMMFLDKERICHSSTSNIDGTPTGSGDNPLIWSIDDFVEMEWNNPRNRMRVLTRLWN